jgi:4-cresol dehydrogenase (hydroxylating)
MPFLGSPLLGDFPTDQLDTLLYEGPPKFAADHLALLQGVEHGFSAALEQYSLTRKIPYWQVNLSYYGPPEVIAAQWQATRKHFSKIKDVTFVDGDILTIPLTPAQKESVHYPELGIPALKIFALGARTPFNPTPASGHLIFAPIIPRSAAAIIEANDVFGKAIRELKLPIYSAFRLPSCFWERSFVYVYSLPVTEDPELNRHFIHSIEEFIKIAAEHGWAEYRTPTIFQDKALDAMSFNNNALRRFYETLKDAIDPNGILSPGRYGIWPRHLRKS